MTEVRLACPFFCGRFLATGGPGGVFVVVSTVFRPDRITDQHTVDLPRGLTLRARRSMSMHPEWEP